MSSFLNNNRLWVMLVVLLLVAAFAIPTIQRKWGGPTPEMVAAANTGWETSFDAAAAKSNDTRKPILIDFTADWCPPCQFMKYDVFLDQSVQTTLQDKVIPLRADVTSQGSNGMALARQYDVQATPTLLVVDAQGNILARQVGAMSARDFKSWLAEHAMAVPASASAAAR